MTEPKKPGIGRVARAGGLLLSMAGIVFVGFAISREWPAVRAGLRQADPVWLAAALVAGAAGLLVVAVAWGVAFKLVGARVPTGVAVRLFFRGEIAKYVPGAPWAVLGRGELSRRIGIPAEMAYASVLLSLMGAYGAAALVGVAAIPAATITGTAGLWALLLLPAGLVLLHPRILGWGRQMAERVLRRELALDIPPWRGSIGLVLRCVPAWLLIGTATWCVARALAPQADYGAVMFATALSWLAGFLFLPAPSGLGVREATFVIAAAPALPLGVAALVAVAARVLFMVLDGAGAVIAWLWRGAPSTERAT